VETVTGTELANQISSANEKPIASDVQSSKSHPSRTSTVVTAAHDQDNNSAYVAESECRFSHAQLPAKTVSASQPIDASGYMTESALILATSELASPPSTQLPSKSLASSQPIGYVTALTANLLQMHTSGYVTDTAVLEQTFPLSIADDDGSNANPNQKADPTTSQLIHKRSTNGTASTISNSYITVPAHDSTSSSVVTQVECNTNRINSAHIVGLSNGQTRQHCASESSGYVTEQTLAEESDSSEWSPTFSIPFQSDTEHSLPDIVGITSDYFIESSTQPDHEVEVTFAAFQKEGMRFDSRQTGYVTDENTTAPLQIPLQFQSENTPGCLSESGHDIQIEQCNGYITETESDATRNQTRFELTDCATSNPPFTTEVTHQLLSMEGLIGHTPSTGNAEFEVATCIGAERYDFSSQHCTSLPISVGGYVTEDFAAI
jgi:hypothetical protein